VVTQAINNLQHADEYYLDGLYDYTCDRSYRLMKRPLDLMLIFMLALPALLVIGIFALLVRRDGGPAFYSQPRIGKGGLVYRLWKLRSMVPNAEAALVNHLADDPRACAEWEAMQKLTNDPRITAVGKFMRKHSIDELPQLFNVLLGDMSLVGPRPMLPEQRKQYPGTAYFNMRPGLTGLWQISDRNRCTFAERAVFDTRYSAIASFSVDMEIVLKTPLVVIRGTGL